MSESTVHRHTSLHAPEESASWGNKSFGTGDAAHHEERLQALELELEAMRRFLGPAIREAIKDGITDVLRDEAVMDNLLERFLGALGRRSTRVAGTFTIGLFSGFPRAAAKYLLVGMIVYSLGGWALVASFFKALFAADRVP